MRLHVRAFGLACALVWGIGLCALTWYIIIFKGESHEVTIIGQFYRGYNISPVGSLVGLLWGFVDGLIGGLIFAWLYNALTRLFRPAESTSG